MSTGNYAFFEVPLGQKVSRFPVDRYKGSKTSKDLVTILSKDPIVTRTFYNKDLGGNCYYMPEFGELGIKAQVKYNFLIAVWETDAKGALVDKDNPGYSVMYLSMGEDMYLDLVDKHELNGDLRKLLLLVKCTDEQYQKLTFNIAGESPLVKSETLRLAVTEDFKTSKNLLASAIATVVTLEKVKEVLGTIDPEEEQEFMGKANLAQANKASLPSPSQKPATPISSLPAADVVNETEGGSFDFGSVDSFVNGFDED